jgi:hypothetical protein
LKIRNEHINTNAPIACHWENEFVNSPRAVARPFGLANDRLNATVWL